ncbi:putative endoribonuclease [Nocardia farcinica IFM 10152]|uniref:Putative endoribonuclease n=1 Tax=Nocardia farcinica (strain IFM 10152) TaxID=247156 RepID=Q5YUL9_NOCFA|nr:putative endoribonuclease [Nocardia farcinica IFM 10152]
MKETPMTRRHLNPTGLHALPELITQVVAVTGGTLVHLSGQVAWDEHGTVVGAGDHAAQAARIAANIDTALAAVGASRADIVKETIYVVDYRPEILPAILSALRGESGRPPASTLVGVAALAFPELLLEVEVVAALDN